MSTLLHDICRIGYVVELERDIDYRVRCIPIPKRIPLAQPPVSVSLHGNDLRDVIATCLAELKRLRLLNERYYTSVRESARVVE
jgi:hypothetical protein